MDEKEVLDTEEKTEKNDVNLQSQNNTNMQNDIPEKYKPISMWGYFGYELLFSIPCVGFILLLVFSFGGTQNINLKNFARSYFCFLIIAAIIAVIIASVVGAGIVGGITGGTIEMQ